MYLTISKIDITKVVKPKIKLTMKSLKITLFVVLLAALFTSCVKEDLNEDDVLLDNQEVQVAPGTGGTVGEQ